MEQTYYCNDPNKKRCSWSGSKGELVALTDDLDDRDFTHCPYCGGTDFTIEEEEEEE